MLCFEMHFLVTQINHTRSDLAHDCAVDVPVVAIHMESKQITELMLHDVSGGGSTFVWDNNQ